MGKLRIIIIGVCLLFACIFTAGCISQEIPDDIADPVLVISVEKEGAIIPANACIQYVLPANPTTGYGWTVIESTGLVVNESYEAAPVPEGWVGGGGYQYYTLTAEQPGTYTFKAGYSRSWETDVDPIYTITQTLVFSDAAENDHDGETMLSVVFNGTINPKAGEVVKITTIGNPTTGYFWEAVPGEGLTVLADNYTIDNTTLIGGGGMYEWLVTANEAGQYQFEATNQRFNQDPVNLFFFNLTFI
ncbi:MAG: protease inhibitor I42 family protein [Methanocorpusculum sp.]|nr:protease inhibitor I42 family protein [Methanocorpusculum sp.]